MRNNKNKKIFNTLSFFSGIGGFEVGMNDLGFNFVKSLEWDNECCNTLNKNFKYQVEASPTDITLIEPEDFYSQEIDFIVGKKFLITVRYELVEPVNDFAKLFETNSLNGHHTMAIHGGFIFMQMMKGFYKKSLHELESLTTTIKNIEQQIFASQEELKDYNLFKKLDIGDIIGCSGFIFKTNRKNSFN
jgi:lysyl-tRNA synthetase class II